MASYIDGYEVCTEEEKTERAAWKWSLWPTLILSAFVLANGAEESKPAVGLTTGVVVLGIFLSKHFRFLLSFVFGIAFLLVFVALVIAFLTSL